MTCALGFVGGIFASAPVIRSMSPSARARARGSPVTIDLGGLRSRQQVSVIWRGKPVWVLRRDEQMLESLAAGNPSTRLSDPDSSREAQQPEYARNSHRSIRSEYFVAIGLCTHLGCVPTFRPEPDSVESSGPWPGGYFCPCHGSKFDLAGRVNRNVPAPTNLVIPPHRYLGDQVIEIGRDQVV